MQQIHKGRLTPGPSSQPRVFVDNIKITRTFLQVWRMEVKSTFWKQIAEISEEVEEGGLLRVLSQAGLLSETLSQSWRRKGKQTKEKMSLQSHLREQGYSIHHAWRAGWAAYIHSHGSLQAWGFLWPIGFLTRRLFSFWNGTKSCNKKKPKCWLLYLGLLGPQNCKPGSSFYYKWYSLRYFAIAAQKRYVNVLTLVSVIIFLHMCQSWEQNL